MGYVELCNFHFCCASTFCQPMKKFEFFVGTRATRQRHSKREALGTRMVPFSSPEPTILLACGRNREALGAFSSPEAALLLVSTKNRDLWPCPTTEVRDSRTSRHSAHALSSPNLIGSGLNLKIHSNVVGPGQRSRFLVLTRSAASGDENALGATISGMRHRCRLRETGWAEFGYFLCYFKMIAPRALDSCRRPEGS